MAFQTGDFNKDSTNTGEKFNWGLLRHIKETNVYGSSTADPGLSYDYVLDGTGVDIVVIDSGIEPDHPEFQDSNGVSRVQQINWFTQSGVFGTQPNGFYADYDGHGTHVASIAAGKTFGWAKNAHIFSIKLTDLRGPSDPFGGLSITQAFDVLIGWHQNKTNGRPTVLVNSWGTLIFWHEDLNAFSFRSDGSGTFYSVNGGEYRGTAWTGSTKDLAKGHVGAPYGNNVYAFPWQSPSIDIDITLCIDAGIVVCNAGGNERQKVATFSDPDYSNYITLENLTNSFYYHRGGSPNIRNYSGFQVGALSSLTLGPTSNQEKKSVYSNAGPGINIYAAGDSIMGAMSAENVYPGSADYHGDATFLQTAISGTSFSAPQVAGLAALLLQIHPNWTNKQVVKYLIDQTKPTLYTTGQDNDYQDTASLYGGDSRNAYIPFGERKVFTYNEVV
jgi:subtilisin family serine protease